MPIVKVTERPNRITVVNPPSRVITAAGQSQPGASGDDGLSAYQIAVANGFVGTVVQSRTVALTGVEATGAVGTVVFSANITLAITGVQATGAVGSVTPSRTKALTGVAATGAVGTVVGSGTTCSIEDYGNGWFRCIVTKDFAGAVPLCVVVPLSGDNNFSNQNGKEYLIWGYQGEAGSYATSYIPTTSASVTRNADVISKTGISSLIGQTEGTVLFDGIADITNPNGAILIYLGSSDGSGAFDYSTYLKFSGNNLNLTVYSGGVNYVNSTSTQTYTNKQNIKVAFSYKNNDFICYANGVQLFTDTTGVVSTNLSSIALGFYPPNIPFNQYNGNINLTALWKTRLTNTQLAQLTTI